MAAGVKFNSFVEAKGRKVHNLHTDVLKIMLTNVAPIAANSVKADLTEITAGNGYTAGGTQVPNTTYVQTAGVAKLLGDDVTFTASVGSIGPYRWAVLYNDTAALDELICFWDYGVSQTLLAGEAQKIDFNAAREILQET
jgi:hypothetical protein